jgi:hypothetical protein
MYKSIFTRVPKTLVYNSIEIFICVDIWNHILLEILMGLIFFLYFIIVSHIWLGRGRETKPQGNWDRGWPFFGPTSSSSSVYAAIGKTYMSPIEL